jgi:hypothetical protein
MFVHQIHIFLTFHVFAAKLMEMMKEDSKLLTSMQSWLVVINAYRTFENHTTSHKWAHFLQHNIHVYMLGTITDQCNSNKKYLKAFCYS